MEENNISIEEIKEEIKKLKMEIIEREEKLDQLLKRINITEEAFDEE